MDNNSSDDALAFHKRLLLPPTGGSADTSIPQQPKAASILPRPGFCLKTKQENGEKVFINVCKADNIPVPKEITDEELVALLESEDPIGFRVPMSLGEPHAELDKGGQGSTAYDVVINPSFYEKVITRDVLQGFFLTIVLEGLEAKYNISLSREWTILKNRKFVGKLIEQNIRTQSKPWIMELDSSDNSVQESRTAKVAQQTQLNKPKAPEPAYTILQEPPDGHPEYLVAEVHLPNVKTAASLMLDIGEDRILLETRANVYHLDIYLPYFLVQELCGAQFNRATKILSITMPVKPVL